jgi:cob(I)alamin adenosyltransferase
VVVFPAGKPPADYLEMYAGGLAKARQAVCGGEYDLVVLDEINVPCFLAW